MIKPATFQDVDAIIALGRQMHAEGAFSIVNFVEKKVRTAIERCIVSGFVYVNVGADGVDGFLIGHASEYWFSHDHIASDLAFYVRPDRRGGIAAVRLIQAFVTWGREHGVREVAISQSSGVRVEEMTHLLTGMGFRYLGGVFKWEIA